MVALLVGLFLIYNTVATSVIGASRRDRRAARARDVAQRRSWRCSSGKPRRSGGNRLRARCPAWLAARLGRGRPDLVDGHDAVCRGRSAGPVAGVVAGGDGLCGRSAAGARGRGGAGARGGACQPDGLAALDAGHRRQPVARGAPACSSLPCVSWRPRAFAALPAVNGLPVFGFVAALAIVFGQAFLVPSVLFLLSRYSTARRRAPAASRAGWRTRTWPARSRASRSRSPRSR